MPNSFAFLVLFLWPVICLLLFKKYTIQKALIISYLGGWLLMPSKTIVDLPILPSLDKESLISLAAMIGCFIIQKNKFSLLPKDRNLKILIIVFLASPFITYLNNSEHVFNGVFWIQPLTFYDAISDFISKYISLIPLVLAVRFFTETNHLILLMKILVLSILLYCTPILFELRFSPQLHMWAYGFYPSDFIQSIRSGGFRAIVFLDHGLMIAFVLMIALVFSISLYKLKVQLIKGVPSLLVIFFLFIVLILQKSMAALFFALLMCILLQLFHAKRISFFACIVFYSSILYQIAAVTHFIPYDSFVSFFNSINPDRAQSLGFRFQNEISLVNLANNKFITGWGGYGRHLLYRSIADASWVIFYGQNGLIGLISIFGILALSINRGFKNLSKLPNKTEQIMLSSMLLLISFISIDQLINASINYNLIWILIGALLGYSNQLKLRHASQNKNT